MNEILLDLVPPVLWSMVMTAELLTFLMLIQSEVLSVTQSGRPLVTIWNSPPSELHSMTDSDNSRPTEESRS